MLAVKSIYTINIFLEKSYTKCGRETILRPFFKKSKWSISLGQHIKMLQSFFVFCLLLFLFFFCCFYFLYVQVKIYQNILKLKCWLLPFTLCNTFLKSKKMFGTSLPALFSTWFLKKYISQVISYQLTKFYCLIAFLRCIV